MKMVNQQREKYFKLHLYLMLVLLNALYSVHCIPWGFIELDKQGYHYLYYSIGYFALSGHENNITGLENWCNVNWSDMFQLFQADSKVFCGGDCLIL